MRTLLLVLCLLCCGCSSLELTVNVPAENPVPKHHKHPVKEKAK